MVARAQTRPVRRLVRPAAAGAVIALPLALIALPATASGSGGQHIPAGSVTHGNVSVWNGPVVVDGEVQGNISVTNGSVVVNGTVDGDVNTWGSPVAITGRVHGHVTGSTGPLVINPGARVGGDVNTYNSTTEVVVQGPVGGHLNVSASDLMVGPQANVGGDVNVWDAHQPGAHRPRWRRSARLQRQADSRDRRPGRRLLRAARAGQAPGIDIEPEHHLTADLGAGRDGIGAPGRGSPLPLAAALARPLRSGGLRYAAGGSRRLRVRGASRSSV